MVRRPPHDGSRTLGYVLCLLGAVSVAALVLAYFYFDIGQQDPLWSGIYGSVIATIIVSTAWYLLFGSRGVSLPPMKAQGDGALVSFFVTHDDVDWGAIIDAARCIDVVVHYYGRWASAHYDQFVAFFRRGGKLRLIMADPEVRGILGIVREHFFPYLTSPQLRGKIVETERVLTEAFEEAGSSRASFEVYYFPKVLHYAFLLADNRLLYLSAYDQFKGSNIRAPVFCLDVGKDHRLEEHWLGNRDRFIREARKAVL